MANLTIPFPEGTRTVVLRGSRITIGRLPENTIQLRDRTISAHHAELILEGGHYRIHDLDATNGVLINGKQVWDYHLHEGCKVMLGNMECEYKLEDPAPEAPGEIDPLPARGEVAAVRQENAKLTATVASLKEQVEAMNKARSSTNGNGHVPGDAGLEAEVDRLAEDRAKVLQTNRDLMSEIGKLKESLAVIRRDRDNLQRAFDEMKNSAPKFVTPPSNTALATPVASAVTSATPQSGPPRLPKPPTTLGTNPPSVPPPTTPVRRPASGVTLPPVRVIGMPAPPQTAAAATGPKGTQKLVE